MTAATAPEQTGMNVAMPRAERRGTLQSLRTDRWTVYHALAAIIMAGLGVLATRTTWVNIYHIATVDDEYSHIFLVPLVAAWMVWVRRMRFRHCKPMGTLIGPIIVFAGWLVMSFGFYHRYQSLWQGGAVLVVIGCAVSVLGKHLLVRFFPAVAVLVFLIPVPGTIRPKIAWPLQTWTARIANGTLQMAGVDSERFANTLWVGGKEVQIAEACNGVRGIFALILVAYAFSFGLPLRNSVRFIILLLSPVVTIFCNVVRILPTAWMYGYASEHAADLLHKYAGWAMLPIAFLLLLGVLKVLRWAMIPVMRYTLAS